MVPWDNTYCKEFNLSFIDNVGHMSPSLLHKYPTNVAPQPKSPHPTQHNTRNHKMPSFFNNPAPTRLPQTPGPNAVRDYIAQALVNKHDATTAAARDIAAHWRFGRVREFRKAPLSTLTRIFGPEAGPVVFQSVREDVLADWLESPVGVMGVGELYTHTYCFLGIAVPDGLWTRLFGSFSRYCRLPLLADHDKIEVKPDSW